MTSARLCIQLAVLVILKTRALYILCLIHMYLLLIYIFFNLFLCQYACKKFQGCNTKKWCEANFLRTHWEFLLEFSKFYIVNPGFFNSYIIYIYMYLVTFIDCSEGVNCYCYSSVCILCLLELKTSLCFLWYLGYIRSLISCHRQSTWNLNIVCLS